MTYQLIRIPSLERSYFKSFSDWCKKLTWKKLLFGGLGLLITAHIFLLIFFQESVNSESITFRHAQRIKSFFHHIIRKLNNKNTTYNPYADEYGSYLDSYSDIPLVLDTPTCKIGLANLWPPEFKNNWNWSSAENKVPNCDQEIKLFHYVKEDEIIKVTYPDFQKCYIREIIRKPDMVNNNFYLEVNQINLTTSRFVKVAHMEMFKIYCNGSYYYNYEANLRFKPEVEERREFWKQKLQIKDTPNLYDDEEHMYHINENDEEEEVITNTPGPEPEPEEERPINVLWLGFDTISSIHLHRSFPKTLQVMKELGFIEFPGFHSIALMTISNFKGFLMGADSSRTNECNSSYENTWDPCPFIWKEFKNRNYVTMFLEDYQGTMNYNELDGGFKVTPVDYYLQSMFFDHMDQRDNLTSETRDCVSTETVPQFLLRYNERFLQKFKSTPFFTFTWMNYPFHALEFGLPNVDADFEKFYRKLQNDPELLDNTLLILNSDHGERYGLYRRKSIDGFLEKSLPPLFMRIPDKLLRKFPHLRLKEFAQRNKNRLVTAFDIHHTLLHVVAMNDQLINLPKLLEENENILKSKAINFEPVLEDRASLFAEVPNNRTCEIVHIGPNMCVCNTHLSTRFVTNPFEAARMIIHSLAHINARLNGSGYEKYCEEWEHASFPLDSADVIQQDGDSSVVLIKFAASPDGDFEAQLRVTLASTPGEPNTIETVTEPVRISSYGNSTWCIPGNSEKEKRIKEYCFCRDDAVMAERLDGDGDGGGNEEDLGATAR